MLACYFHHYEHVSMLMLALSWRNCKYNCISFLSINYVIPVLHFIESFDVLDSTHNLLSQTHPVSPPAYLGKYAWGKKKNVCTYFLRFFCVDYFLITPDKDLLLDSLHSIHSNNLTNTHFGIMFSLSLTLGYTLYISVTLNTHTHTHTLWEIRLGLLVSPRWQNSSLVEPLQLN